MKQLKKIKLYTEITMYSVSGESTLDISIMYIR